MKVARHCGICDGDNLYQVYFEEFYRKDHIEVKGDRPGYEDQVWQEFGK